jgi:glycosyltransferase involved in cell wall biosynthesis
MNKLVNLSVIVVPCFNEENRLNLKYWKNIIDERLNIFWIFVNDGSKDKTIDMLLKLKNKSNVLILDNPTNKGKAEAIRVGMNEALKLSRGFQLIGFCDSDCAFAKEDIFILVDKAITDINNQKTFKIWISSRIALSGRKIIRKRSRHYIGRIISTFISSGWNAAPYDTQSGLKFFCNNSDLKLALLKPFKTKWFCDLELITRTLAQNPKQNIIWEEPLHYWKDIGNSRITIRQFPKIFIEIYQIKKIIAQVKKIEL